jgi:hypothetical protein
MNIFFWVWFPSCTEDLSYCAKDISSAKFWYFYNIFAGRRLISYWRRYSSGSVSIPDRKYWFGANEFELVQKIFLCSRRIFQNILLSLHPLLQKNSEDFFFGCITNFEENVRVFQENCLANNKKFQIWVSIFNFQKATHTQNPRWVDLTHLWVFGTHRLC